MAIYLEYDGIKGNVTAEAYKNHIAINSVDFATCREISMEPGKLSNREVGIPILNEVSLSKTIDASVSQFFRASVGGSSGKKAVLRFVRTGSNNVEEFMSYTLENCLISRYDIEADDTGEMEETISLSFSQIVVSYKDHNATNTAGSPQRTGYDLTTAKPL
ncbi:MAG: type VI secretion system tube protein Hcp [Gammaproteobacteria bacterium]|nr:type VI secretion system tube protein Hcp [Gammaproteobacteria bacterium]